MRKNQNTIFRKVKNIIRFTKITFFYTAKPHYLNPLHLARLCNESYSKKRLKENKRLWSYLNSVREKSRSTGCEFSDFYAIYQIISSNDYRYILELGSGVSSCIIAYSLMEKFERTGKKAVFLSLEENNSYYQNINDIFPDDLKKFVTFVLSPRKEKYYAEFRGCFYENIPDFPYEFIFIDGPTLRQTVTSGKCFNSDLINILLKSTRGIDAILDQRIGTFWILKKILPTADIRYRPIRKLTYFNNVSSMDLDRDIVVGGKERDTESGKDGVGGKGSFLMAAAV